MFLSSQTSRRPWLVRLRLGAPREAQNPTLGSPTDDRTTDRVICPVQDLARRNDHPLVLDQRLVMITDRAIVGWSAIRDRAAGNAGSWDCQTLEPWRQRGIGALRRLSVGTCNHHRR